jgi:hypothetical protein
MNIMQRIIFYMGQDKKNHVQQAKFLWQLDEQ